MFTLYPNRNCIFVSKASSSSICFMTTSYKIHSNKDLLNTHLQIVMTARNGTLTSPQAVNQSVSKMKKQWTYQTIDTSINLEANKSTLSINQHINIALKSVNLRNFKFLQIISRQNLSVLLGCFADDELCQKATDSKRRVFFPGKLYLQHNYVSRFHSYVTINNQLNQSLPKAVLTEQNKCRHPVP